MILLDAPQIGLLDDEEIEIDLAALSLSALDHEGIDLTPYVDLLGAMGERLAAVGRGASTASDQSRALAQVFALEYGFIGDSSTYDAPLNTDMIRVIDRRKGLPVSLSILYVAAARRLGWEADALNTPGHVLATIGGPDGRLLIDPFARGEVVGSTEAQALFSGGGPWSHSARRPAIRPMSNRAILVRLLLNQATRAEQGGDVARAAILYERMTMVAPSIGQGWWDLARIQLQTGDREGARRNLSAMLEVTREPRQRATIVAALESIADDRGEEES